jgi:integrase
MKRKNGEGTWGEKKVNGKTYKFFRDSSGKYFYGKTQKEIKEKVKKHEEQNLTNINYDNSLFGDYMKKWLYDVKQPQIKRRTFDGYEEYFTSFVMNYDDYNISDIKIQKITPENISMLYNSMSKKYALSTIKKVHTLINQCLNYAVDKKVIPDNPSLKAVIPSEDIVAKHKKEIPFLPIEDMEKLYNVSNMVQSKSYKVNGKNGDLVYGNNAKIIVLIMYTGLRISEALGLKWSDVDFKNKQLHVRRNLSSVKNRDDKDNNGKSKVLVETTLKRDSSRRTIPLADRAIEVLKYLKEHSKSDGKDGYVCTSENGTSASQRNITRTLHAMLLRGECEVEKCGLHSLRHSFGSYLIANNVDVSVVSRLLGHKNIMVTYNIYIHVLKQSQIDAINLFNEKFTDADIKDESENDE